MMTWEELMGMTSTTGYDIWSEVTETTNYPTSINGGRHFEPQSHNPIPTNGGRHFKPESNGPTSINGERHFKPPYLETNNPIEALNKAT